MLPERKRVSDVASANTRCITPYIGKREKKSGLVGGTVLVVFCGQANRMYS